MGKTDIQFEYRSSQISEMTDGQFDAMLEDCEASVSDYQVTAAERFKHVSNEMFMLGSCDQDSHIPLLVYIRSCAANKERNFQRKEEHIQKKKSEQKKPSTEKSWSQSGYQGWKNYYGDWKSHDYGSQSEGSYRKWY